MEKEAATRLTRDEIFCLIEFCVGSITRKVQGRGPDDLPDFYPELNRLGELVALLQELKPRAE